MGELNRVLITGASGFLGNYLLKLALPDYHILAQYHSKKPQVEHPGSVLLQLDYASGDLAAIREFVPHVIIHAGAFTNIDRCEQEPQLAEANNLHFTQKLCDLSIEQNARFIFVSTDQVFDGHTGSYRESDPVAPINFYGKLKADAEAYILANHPNAVIARSALIYGKSLHGRPTFTEAMLEKLRNRQPVNVFVDEYRTPVLVDNLAAALWELAENDFRGVIHLGGSEAITRLEMGKTICRLFDGDPAYLIPKKMAEIKLPAQRPQNLTFDISLAKTALKTSFFNIERGLLQAFRAMA